MVLRLLLLLLCPLPALAAPGGFGFTVSSPGYAASLLKRLPTLDGFPSGATHYWAFENNLEDGVGAFDLSGSVSYVAGKNGNAISCGEGVDATGTDDLPVTAAFSIVCWMKNNTDGNGAILAGLFQGVTLQCNAGGSSAGAGTTGTPATGPGVSVGTWHLLVMTYDGSGVVQLSVDGGTFSTGSVSVEDVAGPILFQGTEFIQGYDEPAFFPRALTQQEVADIYSPTFGP